MNAFLISLTFSVWRRLRDFFRVIRLIFLLRQQNAHVGRKIALPDPANTRFQPKPEWVRQEIIRLKALMIHDGSRKIADTLYEHKKQMTVGKTYVCETIKKHLYEIQVLRRKIKHKKPWPLPKNVVAGPDSSVG